MRRKLILAVLILLAFVLQGTVFQTLSIASIVPNLLLILTVSFGFMRGKKEGMFVGFFCGLLIDISRHRKHIPILLQRIGGGDEATALYLAFHHYGSPG